MSSISSVVPKSQDPVSTQCSVCFEPAVICKITLSCNHVFHQACLAAWTPLNNTCPLCRRSVVLLQPESVDGIVYVARFLFNRNQFSEAYDYLRVARNMDQYNTDTHLAIHELADNLRDRALSIRNDDPQEALRLISLLINEDPANDMAKTVRGIIRRDLGNFKEALSDLDSALRLNPSNCLALSIRWNIYYRLGKLREALEDLSVIIERQPDNQQAAMTFQQINDLIAESESSNSSLSEDSQEVDLYAFSVGDRDW